MLLSLAGTRKAPSRWWLNKWLLPWGEHFGMWPNQGHPTRGCEPLGPGWWLLGGGDTGPHCADLCTHIRGRVEGLASRGTGTRERPPALGRLDRPAGLRAGLART